MSTRPTFLLIGAQKCGTTWLAEMLRHHPQVSVPKEKELHFFNKKKRFEFGYDWYESQFKSTHSTVAIGEFTPNYFWTSVDAGEIEESGRTQNIPRLVHQRYPDLRIILMLRDPVERAVSAYYHHIRAGRIHPREKFRIAANHFGVKTIGFYDIHLARWLEYFKRENLLILFFEEDLLVQNKRCTLNRVCRHIGVSDQYEPPDINKRLNSREAHLLLRLRALGMGSAARRIFWRYCPSRIRHSKLWRIDIAPSELDALREEYIPHNLELAAMLDRELPWST